MSKKKIVFVAIYVRKSRDNSESLESQLNSIVEYCIRMGWEYEIFMEEGSSSSEDWNRPKLQLMIQKIEAQHFDAVVVTEQSRITRADEFPKFRDILVDANCLFVTTDSGTIYDYTKPQDEFMSDINSAVAKQELAYGKIRLKRGTVQSAKKGNWVGKKSPVGYEYDRKTKRLKPDEDAPVIREMFELYLDGLSTKEIALKFSREGRVTKAGIKWTSAGISRLLSNEVYAGHSVYGKTTQKKDKKTRKRITKKTDKDQQIIVRNTHDPLITPVKFHEVQLVKQKRNSRPVAMKLGKHAFSGLIRCGICGAIHSFQRAHGKWRITSCQTRNYADDMETYELCPNKGANLYLFEDLVHLELSEYVKELRNHAGLIEDSQEDSSSKETLIQAKERQLRNLEKQVKKTQQGFILEIFTEEEAQEQTKALKAQMDVLESQLEELRKPEETVDEYVQDTLEKLQEFLEGESVLSEREKNEVLAEVIDTIIYTKTGNEMEVTIHWK